MDVIGNSADLQQSSAFSPDDAAHIFVEPLAQPLVNGRRPILGGEDDVEEKIGEGACHEGLSPVRIGFVFR